MEINNSEMVVLKATCDEVALDVNAALLDLQLTYAGPVGLGDVVFG
jgi:hypothetical protein